MAFYCGRWDLNPHDLNGHRHLKPARLPIPPLPQMSSPLTEGILTSSHFNVKNDFFIPAKPHTDLYPFTRHIERYRRKSALANSTNSLVRFSSLIIGKACDRLVTGSSGHYCTSTSVLSTSCSLRGLGISHLEGGFTLRCLQRLSLPDLATLPCTWYTTDTPAVRPPRSSRTKGSSSQISSARAG